MVGNGCRSVLPERTVAATSFSGLVVPANRSGVFSMSLATRQNQLTNSDANQHNQNGNALGLVPKLRLLPCVVLGTSSSAPFDSPNYLGLAGG